MQNVPLSNGVEMPVLGYGVFQIDNDTTARCVADAIDAGYRLIDLSAFADVAPMVNQVETHVFWQERPEHEVMEQLGVKYMAWSPFAEGQNGFFQNPVLTEIGERHGKSVGQVALRYLLDNDVIVIPKSTHKERMEENIDVFDFELSDEEKTQIAALDGGRSIIFDHTDPKTVSYLTNLVKEQMGA